MTSKKIIMMVLILALLVGVAATANRAVAKSQVGVVGISANESAAFSRSAQNASLQSPGQAGKKPGAPTDKWSKCKYGGSAGEATQEKIFNSYSNSIDTYIYMRCGLVYSTYQTDGCGCRAGGWRYTTKCVKTKPVIINLPCHRKAVFVAQ